MGFFKKVFRPVRKIAKKIIPKEIRPALPFIASAYFGPSTGGLGNLFTREGAKLLAQKAAIAAGTAAATDEDANLARVAALSIAPDVLGSASESAAGLDFFKNNPKTISALEKTASFLRPESGVNFDQAQLIGSQTAIDQSAKFAEINQQEIDDYNANLLSQGLKDKGARRNAIYNIYINAGYQPDYVNGVLDRYGYAKGGEVGGVMKATAASMSLKDFAKEIREKQKKKKEKKASGGRIGFNKGGRAEIITGLLNIKDADGNLIYSYEDAVDKANELLPDEVKSEDLQSAVGGLEAAFGRPFGNIEPVPMMRFARGGEVEIEEETDDLNIMDFMRDQGVEYGEQASNAQNDEILQNLYEEFLDLGFSPEDAAKKARQAFDEMSQRPNEGIMQMASGYKTDIEDMYEQYVFEMEEQGLQPMSFSEFLAQARSGMAHGGSIHHARRMEAGGIMNRNLLNTGMDKDMRGGGFIPEGTKEKADDVPARLSKNEFVMTADAVRAAGGGSVNEGAKRMYDTMHRLEAKV